MTTKPPDIDWNGYADQEPADDTPTPTRERPMLPEPTPAGDTRAQSERARVLRHPAIAARLCERPLNYSRPENWNGYVPPEMWRERVNDAPQRAALLDIITAAIEADKEAGQ